MKWILGTMFAMISLASSASANCKIDFENEISANRTTHSLFRNISANKILLANKGFRLVSAIGPVPMFSGFIQVDDIDSSILEMTVYKMDSPKIWRRTVKFRSLSIGVRSLIKKLPSCNKFPT